MQKPVTHPLEAALAVPKSGAKLAVTEPFTAAEQVIELTSKNVID